MKIGQFCLSVVVVCFGTAAVEVEAVRFSAVVVEAVVTGKSCLADDVFF